MTKSVKVSIVHDEMGNILSVSRPAKNAKVDVLGSNGHSVLVTDVPEDSIRNLIGNHRVDRNSNMLVHC